MVSPKTVCSANNGEKSPVIQPFEEPEGMISIDLSGIKNRKQAPSQDARNKKSTKKCVVGIGLGLFLLNIAAFSLLVFIYQETDWFATKSLANENVVPIHITDKENEASIEDFIKRCLFTKPTEHCCESFAGKNADFTYFCLNNHLYTTDEGSRKRKDVSKSKSSTDDKTTKEKYSSHTQSKLSPKTRERRQTGNVKSAPKEAKTTQVDKHFEYPLVPKALPFDGDGYIFYEDYSDLAYENPLEGFVHYQDDINYPYIESFKSDPRFETKPTIQHEKYYVKNGLVTDRKEKSSILDDKRTKTIQSHELATEKLKMSTINPVVTFQTTNSHSDTITYRDNQSPTNAKIINNTSDGFVKDAILSPPTLETGREKEELDAKIRSNNNKTEKYENGQKDFNNTTQSVMKLGNKARQSSSEKDEKLGSRTLDNKKSKDRSNTARDPRNREKNDIQLATLDLQQNPPTMYNPCLLSMGQTSPYKLVPSDNNQVFKIVSAPTPKFTQYMVNPPVYPYLQTPYVVSQPMVQNYMPTMNRQMQNVPIQVNGPGGQYYICNPLSAPTNNLVPANVNNIANIPGVEVREAYDLLGYALKEKETSNNRSRSSQIICPLGYEACADDSKCILKHHFCDNEAHCNDGSDEMFCSCKERVGKFRNCDGYFDCPDGQDELGCFGCDKDEFSCDDWSKFRKSTCIPIKQRCDNIMQCEITGKDEEDCSVLTDNIGQQPLHKVSNSIGFLHRNYKGKWYPTCFGSELWALDVCKVESGPISVFPRTHMVFTDDAYDGPFINILPDKKISLVKNCVEDRAAFVECPALFCGMRMTTKNPYRPQEVDISAENIISDMERISYYHHIHHNVERTAKTTEDDPILGDSRVVGGIPSQPAAWPWLISIYRNGVFHCGGVLIHESWIITAAHCTDRYWQFYYEIQAGMLRRFSFAPMEQYRHVTVVITNENYDRNTLRNDIALMKLSAPVRFNRYVRPICLPSETTAGKNFNAGPAAGTICTTVGWGATIEHGSDPDHMREVEVPILGRCKHKDDMGEDEICAGLSEGGKDACQGDSGGPLMCRNPNNPSQWYLAGIVSHGEGCARPEEPGVYTKVGKYVGWIVENFADEKFMRRNPLQHCPGYVCDSSKKCLPKKHHCDKIVDCLFGDDEANCRFSLENLFKHSMRLSENADDDTLSNNSTFSSIKLSNNTTGGTEKVGFWNSSGEYANSNSTEPFGNHVYFTCKSLLQKIPFSKRCNKKVDCEDGTDEENCECNDYVRSQNPRAICDGITDCLDRSDEQCVKCNDDEFYCRLSQMCIHKAKRCDGKSDCSKHEDEWDCVALTDAKSVHFDPDLRPQLEMAGVITVNRNGIWRPFCLNSTARAATVVSAVCNLLGFEEYQSYNKYFPKESSRQNEEKPLDKKVDSVIIAEDGGRNKNCSGLYVKCSNVSLDSSVNSDRSGNVGDEIELYTTPWNAVIYADGKYRCMGAILSSQWIVTSKNCFAGITDLNLHYVAVLLGKGKASLQVKGPHELTLRVVESSLVSNSDIVLLRTEKNILCNRYIKHLRFNLRRDGIRKEKCVAIGLHDNKAKYEFLSPIQNCKVGFRCFEAKLKSGCTDATAWSGTIICDSGNGWYSAAVFFEKDGLCGLSSVKNYTSVPFHKKEIRKVMEQVSFNVDAPNCDGFRCALGECISRNKTCDGIPDCRGAEDEESDLCYERESICHLTGKCECRHTELKCKNNKCIHKSLFCDKKDDCGDSSDEPDICDCRSYLQLTNPHKICDGVVNCMDRTDEDPKQCPCRPEGFKCSDHCVAEEMICDDVEDCPNGEDEKVCYKIVNEQNQISQAGEVLRRTGGVWHSGCFKSNYSQTELEKICLDLGFFGGISHQFTPPKNVVSVSASRPILDDFNVIRLYRNSNGKYQLAIRTGNEPYVNFVPDETCLKLFMACL